MISESAVGIIDKKSLRAASRARVRLVLLQPQWWGCRRALIPLLESRRLRQSTDSVRSPPAGMMQARVFKSSVRWAIAISSIGEHKARIESRCEECPVRIDSGVIRRFYSKNSLDLERERGSQA